MLDSNKHLFLWLAEDSILPELGRLTNSPFANERMPYVTPLLFY